MGRKGGGLEEDSLAKKDEGEGGSEAESGLRSEGDRQATSALATAGQQLSLAS